MLFFYTYPSAHSNHHLTLVGLSMVNCTLNIKNRVAFSNLLNYELRLNYLLKLNSSLCLFVCAYGNNCYDLNVLLGDLLSPSPTTVTPHMRTLQLQISLCISAV